MKSKTNKATDAKMNKGKRMPAIFIGHGSPMNAMEDNEFTRAWQQLGKSLPRPRAILCISAHWETWGILVTAMQEPRTIHDFGGFPAGLYQLEYPAPGSSWLAGEVRSSIALGDVGFDLDWGLDHGCWSVLKRMYPEFDLPVVQLSLDYTQSAKEHYAIGKEFMGSGNMVHNLGLVEIREGLRDFNRPFGYDWALEANELFKKMIVEERHEQLADYQALGEAVRLAIPTPEHFLPLLYALAVRQKGEKISFMNDQPMAGSITMTSLIIG